MTAVAHELGIEDRVAALNALAKRDPKAAQDEVWAWLKDLGKGLPGAESEAILDELYAACAPADIDGQTEGLLVGFVTPKDLNLAGQAIRQLAPLTLKAIPMPWLGKKFDKSAMRGTNAITGLAGNALKVLLPLYKRPARVGDHFEAFDMLNRFEESVISPGTEVLVLDYETKEVANPWPVSNIRDEAVQVVPGVLLGAKLWRQDDGYRQFAWWAAKSPA